MFKRLTILLLAVFVIVGLACGDVVLPGVIGSHMVMQRNMPLPVWGKADPGEAVTVEMDGEKAETKAGDDGRWSVKLGGGKAGGPFEMTITGKNTILLDDIMLGEVWVCSGQSNMEMGLSATANGEHEVSQANHPNIRLFHVVKRPSGHWQFDVVSAGGWQRCSPESIRDGRGWQGFSAVAYYFARHLQQELGIAVGVIDTSWGGTNIETWTTRDGFASVKGLENFVKQIDNGETSYQASARNSFDEIERWVNAAKKATQEGNPLPPAAAWPTHPLSNAGPPTGLYNGMVNGLVPFAIGGVIWYQGESNNGQGMGYYTKMEALINGWREVWGQGDFPFYYVQLAPYDYGAHRKFELAEIWEAQTAALKLANTGMAVTNDIVGNVKDIHPQNKVDVGRRLALWALAKDYGNTDLVYSGPLYKSMAVEGDKIRISFDHTGTGLASRDGKSLDWFEVAGENGEYLKADAVIDGDTVVVSNAGISEPKNVRFAWDQVAQPNLMNKEKLPAGAFRTAK